MNIRHISVDWFEDNKLGCLWSPEDGTIGYITSGRNSVNDEDVLTGNKPQREKNNNCGGHPQEENGERSSSGIPFTFRNI